MSRNLCEVECDFCGNTPKLEEKPRLITKEEAGVYFDEFEGMLVANAICPSCEAKYLAWVDESGRKDYTGPAGRYVWDQVRVPGRDDPPFFDLSFRSTFNDEPGKDDLPTYKIEIRRVRVGPYPDPYEEEHNE